MDIKKEINRRGLINMNKDIYDHYTNIMRN